MRGRVIKAMCQAVLPVAGSLLLAGGAGATTYNFASTDDTVDYETTGTWTPASATGGPVAGDVLDLTIAGSKTLRFSADHTVASLTAGVTSGKIWTFAPGTTTTYTLHVTSGLVKNGAGALNLGTQTGGLILDTPSIALNAGALEFRTSQTLGTAGVDYLSIAGGDLRVATIGATPAGNTALTIAGNITFGASTSPAFRLIQSGTSNTSNVAVLTLNGGFKGTLASNRNVTFLITNLSGGASHVVNLNGAADAAAGTDTAFLGFGGGAVGTGSQFKFGVLNLGHSSAIAANATLNLGQSAAFNLTTTTNLEAYLNGALTIANNVNVYGYSGSGTSYVESYTLGGKNAGGTTATWGGTINLAKSATLKSTDANAKLLFANVLSDGDAVSAVTVAGAGLVELAAANTYEGGTTVLAGSTLKVSNPTGSATGTGSVSVAGTLHGEGAVAGPVSVTGTLAPGDGVGSLTVSSTLNLAGTTQMQLGASANDQVVGVTDITFGGALQVTLDGGGPAFASGQVFDLFDWSGTRTGSFSSIVLPTLASGLSWADFGGQSFDYATGQIAVVPEPAALSLAGVAVGVLFRRRRVR